MISLSKSLQPFSLGLHSLPLLVSFPLKLQGAGKRRSPCTPDLTPSSHSLHGHHGQHDPTQHLKPGWTSSHWRPRVNVRIFSLFSITPLEPSPSLSHCSTVWVFKVTKIVKRKYIKRNKKTLGSSRRKDP